MVLKAPLIAFFIATISACAGGGEPGPVTLEIGTGVDSTYSALEDGAVCALRLRSSGYSAGYRVRGQNIPDGAQLDCGLLIGAELVSERPTIMRDSGEVSYGILQIVLPKEEPDWVPALAGQTGELYCYYEEELFSVDVVIDVPVPGD